MFDQNQLHAVDQATPRPVAVPAGAVSQPGAPAVSVQGDPARTTENADIYYMPENFQKKNPVAGRNTMIPGIWVLLTVIFILLLLGGGLFIFWTQPGFLGGLFGQPADQAAQPAPAASSQNANTPLEPAASARPSGSPKELYLVFRSELGVADTVDSYLAAYSKYATAARYAALLEAKTKAESGAPANADILAALRADAVPALDGTEEISEEITDQRAVLTITKTNKRSIGTVVFLPEKGQWKLSQELWQDTGEPEANAPAASPQAASDDDKDGLGNQEEAIFGTDPKQADSDADGYNDLAEITNGYNPAGNGKLADNKGLATYLNTTFNISLLYPAAWKKTIATSDDSIIFTAPDGQFIQVLVQPNSDREDIVTWYRKTFNSDTIPASQILVSPDWDGVRKGDGLVAYLTNKDKSYIFTVAYNLGTTSVTTYKNVLDAMLRSLKIAS